MREQAMMVRELSEAEIEAVDGGTLAALFVVGQLIGAGVTWTMRLSGSYEQGVKDLS
jgi:hypothetical protein